ncbi:pentapeptide repeat-containing protein [Sulfitobacter sp. SH24]|uniref:pentapeptide repeat-containing protein n=1 Tax=Sulfitobacter sp. SH24 TaxID=3421173 RepID=UPI003F50029A
MKKHSNEDDIFDWLGLERYPNWSKARALGPVIAVLFIIVFALALFSTVSLLLNMVFNDGTATLGSGALMAAILGSPFLLWGTVLKHRTVSFQKEGHITDRINKATEQLGAEKTVKRLLSRSEKLIFTKHDYACDDKAEPVFGEVTCPNIEVRIGGILSLERIAQDSTTYDGGRDHVRIMEILCAYIRENSHEYKKFPLPDWEPLGDGADEVTQLLHKSQLDERTQEYKLFGKAYDWAGALPSLRIDLQLALNVIGRRTEEQRMVEAVWPDKLGKRFIPRVAESLPKLQDSLNVEGLLSKETMAIQQHIEGWVQSLEAYSGYRLDLRGANLQGGDFSAKRIDRSDASFSGLLLEGAKLDGASFKGAQLRGASFTSASLNGVTFSHADLAGAQFHAHCQLEGARFVNAELTASRFSEAMLLGAIFTGANLDFATIDSSILEACWFIQAQARFSNISSCHFFGIKARSLDVSMANLSDIKHGTAIFDGKNITSGLALKEIDLLSIELSSVDLGLIFGDVSVLLPEECFRPDHWAFERLRWREFYEEVSKWHGELGARYSIGL